MHCQNKDNGCQDEIALENYDVHNKNCSFALKKCPIENCNRQFKLSEETAHQLEHAKELISKVSA